MKKFRIIVLATLVVTLIPFLQSCLDSGNDNDDYFVTCPDGGKLAIGTVIVPDPAASRNFYFALDEGIKVFPGDTTAIRSFQPKDGQRVFIGYLKNEVEIPGYEINGRIFTIENILTKEIIPLTAETADSIGDDRINVTTHSLTNEYLTIECQYFSSQNANKKHMLNLVENKTIDKEEEDGYILLEFRHNAFKDEPLKIGPSIVSFRLTHIAEKMKEAKGVKVRVNTINDGVKSLQIDFKK